jgi:hypothetical protein
MCFVGGGVVVVVLLLLFLTVTGQPENKEL